MSISIWVWSLLGISIGTAAALAVKIILMRKAAYEIRDGVAYRLRTDTNTLLDISSRDKAMRSLAQGLNEELGSLRRKRHMYERGNLALQEEITNISHDLRTPLTAMRGYLELLEKEELRQKMPKNIVRYLNIISERTEALSDLTEKLFRYTLAAPVTDDWAKEADRADGNGTYCGSADDGADLGRLIEESVLAYYGALTGKGIEPIVDLPGIKIQSRINIEAARRIFGNIIGNALKYSDGDLRITLSENGEIIFANHASSLDAVQTGRLFDRFYTVESGRTSTGLGLAIAKRLTEQMGGSIFAWYDNGMLYLKLRFPACQ